MIRRRLHAFTRRHSRVLYLCAGGLFFFACGVPALFASVDSVAPDPRKVEDWLSVLTRFMGVGGFLIAAFSAWLSLFLHKEIAQNSEKILKAIHDGYVPREVHEVEMRQVRRDISRIEQRHAATD